MGGMEGGTPPEGADGEAPALPDGETMPDRGERPDMPEGEPGSDPEDMTPPDGGQPASPDDRTPPEGENGERPASPDGMGGMQMESALGISAGSVVTIQDADGSTLYETTAADRMSGVIFSSDAVAEGETYTLLVDGETVETAEAVLGVSNDTGMGGQPSGGTGFRDVQADAYYADAVSWATEQGIVTGTSQTAFSPDESVTREQMAALLYRYAGEPSAAGDLSAYADADSVSAYASDAMAWCVENGVLNGTDGSRLEPAASATRAEVAAVLQRFAAL